MSKLINLVLLYGGKSGEHEISLISAASVLAHLDAKNIILFLLLWIKMDYCININTRIY